MPPRKPSRPQPAKRKKKFGKAEVVAAGLGLAGAAWVASADHTTAGATEPTVEDARQGDAERRLATRYSEDVHELAPRSVEEGEFDTGDTGLEMPAGPSPYLAELTEDITGYLVDAYPEVGVVPMVVGSETLFADSEGNLIFGLHDDGDNGVTLELSDAMSGWVETTEGDGKVGFAITEGFYDQDGENVLTGVTDTVMRMHGWEQAQANMEYIESELPGGGFMRVAADQAGTVDIANGIGSTTSEFRGYMSDIGAEEVNAQDTQSEHREG